MLNLFTERQQADKSLQIKPLSHSKREEERKGKRKNIQIRKDRGIDRNH